MEQLNFEQAVDLTALLSNLQQLQIIRPLDSQFAGFILRAEQQAGTAGDADSRALLALLAALTSLQLSRGEVCLQLSQLPQQLSGWPAPLRRQAEALFAPLCESRLLASVTVSDGCSEAPLVLQQGRLYLYRYWHYESAVAATIDRLAVPITRDPQSVAAGLTRFFPDPLAGETDWQQVAVAIALSRRFSVISGGPGTGKTTTVARLLGLWLELQQAESGPSSPVIRLAAPTGKAAARLSESLGRARDELPLEDQLKGMIPDQAVTLHRLLGPRPNSKSFRHNRSNPLHLDLLVVDEASMIDLPMMHRLLDALPEQAQLIMIGDKDQLASVEAGSVLGDICSWDSYGQSGAPVYSAAQTAYLRQCCDLPDSVPAAEAGVADALALLRKSYRFDAGSGIGQLARAVNQGNGAAAVASFTAGFSDIGHIELNDAGYTRMLNQVVDGYRPCLQLIRERAAPAEILRSFAQCQLLAVLREGPYGVSGLNDAVAKQLRQRRLIEGNDLWYQGRPVMITRNDYQLGLYNGDIGIAVNDDSGKLRVWFEWPDGEVKGILPGRLPAHETVYAMTVHKSQGSEFDSVLMILPVEDSALLTRELIYTGITRARQGFTLIGRQQSLVNGTERRTERASGLAWRLWR